MSECETCGRVLPPRNGPGAPRRYCDQSCRNRIPGRVAFIKSPVQSERRKAWRKSNQQRLSQAKATSHELAKIEGLRHYGGKCECCGESTVEFLTIEHKNGRDPNVTRYTGKRAWIDLKRKGWPADITILYFNCNCAKGAFGKCPHQK